MVGGALGLGLENKQLPLLLAVSLAIGPALDRRLVRVLRSRWLWAGIALGVVPMAALPRLAGQSRLATARARCRRPPGRGGREPRDADPAPTAARRTVACACARGRVVGSSAGCHAAVMALAGLRLSGTPRRAVRHRWEAVLRCAFPLLPARRRHGSRGALARPPRPVGGSRRRAGPVDCPGGPRRTARAARRPDRRHADRRPQRGCDRTINGRSSSNRRGGVRKPSRGRTPDGRGLCGQLRRSRRDRPLRPGAGAAAGPTPPTMRMHGSASHPTRPAQSSCWAIATLSSTLRAAGRLRRSTTGSTSTTRNRAVPSSCVRPRQRAGTSSGRSSRTSTRRR